MSYPGRYDDPSTVVIPQLLIILIILLPIIVLAYWLLVTTEGVFLGRRVVVWFYDLTAGRYDRVKQFDRADERILVANPILEAVQGSIGVKRSRLLDVATGTGRVPYDLMQSKRFTGHIVGLDASRGMLSEAARKLSPFNSQVSLVRGRAGDLPFPDNWFDAISCLEALEFFPSDERALGEMLRVLRDGGQLFVTRRCGTEGRMFLHRHRSEAEFMQLLCKFGAPEARAFHWEVGYDLIIARKGQKVCAGTAVRETEVG